MPLSFWTSFWPALASGMIYSTFTGIIVGLFVTLFGYRMEEQRRRSKYEAEFAICRERLHIALSRPDVIVLEGPAESFPSHALSAMTIMRDYPLTLWRQHLFEDHRKIFTSMAQFLHAYTSFNSAAGLLSNALLSAVRKLNASQSQEADHDAGLIRFFTGNALGLPDEEIIPWIPSAVPEQLRAGFLTLTYDVQLSPLVEPFRKSRKHLEAAAAALSKSIQQLGEERRFENQTLPE